MAVTAAVGIHHVIGKKPLLFFVSIILSHDAIRAHERTRQNAKSARRRTSKANWPIKLWPDPFPCWVLTQLWSS